MIDIVESYIKENTTTEMNELLKGCCSLLEDLEYQTLDDELLSIIMDSDDVHGAEIMSTIINQISGILHDILKQHGVILADNEFTTLEILYKFANSTLNIQSYEDKSLLLDILNSDVNSKETYAELIALICDLTVEELLPYIESVDDCLLITFKELLISNEEPASSDNADIVNDFINYLNKHTESLKIKEMIKNGMSVGYPFSIYINALGRDLETLEPKLAAKELLGMAYVSSDGGNNPRSIIKEHLDQFVSDIDKLTKIDIALGELLLGQ